jgi:hypothetical protein
MRANRTEARRAAWCEGKTRFETFGRAERAAKRHVKRYDGRVQPYACHLCGGFHIGTTVGGPSTPIPDLRGRYSVYAHHGDGATVHAGFSDSPDGGATAKALADEGWIIDSIVTRRRAA